MSYNKILNILNTKAIAGPHLAFGLKKRGEQRGVWLFGEGHEKDEDYGAENNGFNAQDIVNIEDLLQVDNTGDINNTFLVYEGINAPGKRIFKDAPEEIKDEVRLLTPDLDTLRERGVEKYEPDEDGEVPEEPNSSELAEAGYNLDEANLNLKESWNDPDFWDFYLEQVGELTVTGEKMTSRGGISINIDDKIRTYFIDAIAYHEEQNIEIDIDRFFKIISWALNHNLPLGTEPLGDISGVELLPRKSVRDFICALLKHTNFKWGSTFPSKLLGEIMGEIMVLVDDDLATGKPFMFGQHKMRFIALFVMIMMDMNIVPRMKENIDRDMVSYCGAAHTLNQLIILHQQGYVIEHTYFNPNMDFLSPLSKKPNLELLIDAPLRATLRYLRMNYEPHE